MATKEVLRIISQDDECFEISRTKSRKVVNEIKDVSRGVDTI
jgi:hypothetical protein